MRPPEVVWLELTSKCPFDCTFCSRRNRRGAGLHMPIAKVAQVCSELRGASVIRLNYSGESVNHPEFDHALWLAAQTGAQTELVTALASTPTSHLRAFVDHGLDRVSISLHTLDAEQFQRIYRFSSLEQLRGKVAELVEYKRERGATKPVLDFSVVAMRENLGQLPALAGYARELGIRIVTVHAVIRRDPADADMSWELAGPQQLSEAFAHELRAALDSVSTAIPEVAVTVSRPAAATTGAGPFTCEQNPFETTHILADGTVVPCEVLDCKSLGDLNRNAFGQIWGARRIERFGRTIWRTGLKLARSASSASRRRWWVRCCPFMDGTIAILRARFGAVARRRRWFRRKARDCSKSMAFFHRRRWARTIRDSVPGRNRGPGV